MITNTNGFVRNSLILAALILGISTSKGALAGVTPEPIPVPMCPGYLELDPSHVHFGSVIVGSTETRTINVHNHGWDAHIVQDWVSHYFSFAGGSYPGTGGTCGSIIPAHSSCSIVLAFTPTDSHPYEGLFSISYSYDGLSVCSSQAGLFGFGVVVQ